MLENVFFAYSALRKPDWSTYGMVFYNPRKRVRHHVTGLIIHELNTCNSGMKILIIDDDGDDRDLFCETLRELYPSSLCLVCDSGEEALTYLRSATELPDYIFLDVYMSGMDGKECLVKIKSILPIRKVPVIMYSGVEDANQVAIYKKLGAAQFVCKPSSVEALKTILLSMLNRSPS